MGFFEMIFGLAFVGIVADMVVKVAKGRGGSKEIKTLQARVEELQRQVDEQAAQIADTDAELGSYAGQLEEMHQRLDFAERLLAQARKQPQIPGPPM